MFVLRYYIIENLAVEQLQGWLLGNDILNSALVKTSIKAVSKLGSRNILLLIFRCDKSDVKFIQCPVGLQPLIPVLEFIQIFFPRLSF